MRDEGGAIVTKERKRKNKRKRRSLNHRCSACGNRPARAREGMHACGTCARLPLQQFKEFAAELVRISAEE